MEAKIAGKRPAVMELEPGTYFYCACGLSAKQPFCDGSHSGSGFSPISFKVTEKRSYAICQCKRTGNQPFCDGAHKNLD